VRTAIISDIHANLEALNVVLGHIDSQNVERIICLGDVLGYGPNPVECVDLVAEHCDWSLMGNHDYGGKGHSHEPWKAGHQVKGLPSDLTEHSSSVGESITAR
jgi:predicted phosphodiesterase